MLSPGNGKFDYSNAFKVKCDFSYYSNYVSTQWVDLNGDGTADLICNKAYEGEWSIKFSNGNG